MSRLALCLVLALVASQVNAASIKWTGYANNNQWGTATNWYPDSVPGPSDDVTINSGSIIITTPVTVNSIGMGNEFSATANLTVLSSLNVISALTVDGNGNLIMTSGASAISGTVNVGGTFIFSSGMIGGSWTIGTHGSAVLGTAGEKVFSGCGFNSSGSVTATGLVVLNQSSVVGIASTIVASGDFMIQAQDNTPVVFDTSAGSLTYTGGGTFSVQAPLNLGTFDFQAGNLTLFDSVNFVNSFMLPSGSVLKTLGTAVATLPAGVTGSGEIHAEGMSLLIGNANFTGLLIAQAGVVGFSASSSVGTLSMTGAALMITNPLSVGQLNLQDGSLQGSSTVTAASASILSAGFVINASVVFTGSASCMGSVLAFGKPGKITVTSGATFTLSSTVTFTGPTGTGGVVNHGVIATSGATSFQNIDLTGTGSVTVSDSLSVNTIVIEQAAVALSGNGVFKGATTEIRVIKSVTGSPSVDATIGSYTFVCDQACKNIRTVGIPTSNFHFKVGN